jgi:membrane-associated phospholipid phosphatase
MIIILRKNIQKKVVLIIFFLFFIYNVNFLYAEDRIETAGDILEITLPVSALSLTFVYKDTNGTKQFIKSFGTTLGVTYFLKYTIHKKRPNGGEHSFPSGHTSSSFASAAFIQKRYGWKYGVPAYLAATFVGYSRIECKAHYIEDVLAGALIGITASYLFTKKFLPAQLQKKHFSFFLVSDFHSYNFFFQFDF